MKSRTFQKAGASYIREEHEEHPEGFIVPTIFGAGWTVNLRSATRHPLQAGIFTALVLWSICRSRRR